MARGTPLRVQVQPLARVPRVERDVLALLAWEQRVAASDELAADDRSAPASEAVLTCLDIVELPGAVAGAWPRRVAAVALMAVVAASVWFIAGAPLVDGLASDKPPAHFGEAHDGPSSSGE